MLVRDNTPVYSSLGRWAGRRVNNYGDWMSLLEAGIGATATTISGVAGAVAAGAKKDQPAVTTTQPTVGVSGGYYPPQQQTIVKGKSWYQDPLTLGAIGLGVVGLGFVMFSGRRRSVAGYAGYSRRRRSRRHSRR